MVEPTVPKFWSSLPFWQVLLVFAGVQLLCLLLVVALREGLSLGVPIWVGSGVGGALGVVAVSQLAARKRRDSR